MWINKIVIYIHIFGSFVLPVDANYYDISIIITYHITQQIDIYENIFVIVNKSLFEIQGEQQEKEQHFFQIPNFLKNHDPFYRWFF